MTTTITHSKTQLKIFDNVMLLEDVPDYTLRKGSIGTIVEFLKPGVYEVDFSDNQGQTYAMCSVHEHQLVPVPDSVLEFLEAIEDNNFRFNLEKLKERVYPHKSDRNDRSDLVPLQVLVPQKVLNWLVEIAHFREFLSTETLARSYIGEGLRADLDRLGIDRLLAETEQVLSEQLESQDEVNLIMKMIQIRYQQWQIPHS